MTGRNVGKTCRTHYRGTFNDGTQFDSSYDRGEPLEFVCGAGQMIKGFDAAVADMEVGEIKEIHLMPEEAYGMPNPNMILTLERAYGLHHGPGPGGRGGRRGEKRLFPEAYQPGAGACDPGADDGAGGKG